MRTSGVLCTLLLMVGGSCAFPQYGQPQEQLQQEPQQPLTEEEQAALGEFWWQNQGVFNPEGNGGTVVVVHDPVPETGGQVPGDLASPFIPSPSPECGALHGCIPWQYCVDGKFTNTGEGLLALRTPSKVPETYSQKLCGQIGNLCCRIPDALLAVQQQGQGGGPAPYEGGSVDGIIEVVSTGLADGTVAIVDQTSGAGATGVIVEQLSGGGGAYGGGVGTTGTIVEQISGGGAGATPAILEQISGIGAGATGTIVELISGGAAGATGTIVEQISGGGGGYSGGGSTGTIVEQINSGGAGTTGTIVEQISGGGGGYSGGGSTGTIVEQTSSGGAGTTGTIVEQISGGGGGYSGGGSTGTIVEQTSSGGAGTTGTIVEQISGGGGGYSGGGSTGTIVEQTSSGGAGTTGTIVEQINGGVVGGTGVIVEQVSGGGGGGYSGGGTGAINVDGGVSTGGQQVDAGIIAIAEIAASGCPAYTHDCVPYFQCIDGEINTSGAGLIDLRIRPQKECTNPEYPDVPGICCRIPGATTPTPPLQTCPGNTVCLAKGQCSAGGAAGTDSTGVITTGGYDICYLNFVDVTNYETGECCLPPPPPPPAHLVTCPGSQVCVTQGQCLTQGTGGYGGAVITSCYYSADQSVIGECCDAPPPPPPPTTPEPLISCPGTQDCVESYQCSTDGTINTDGASLINVRVYHKICYIDVATSHTGVCCQPPVPTPPPTPAPLVTCPDPQVCISQGDCAVQSVATGGTGASYTPTCYIDAANLVTGVCCVPPPPTTPAPVVTCPGDQVCLTEGDCASQSAATGGTGASYITCVKDPATYATGVCCASPIRVVNVCPDDSVCLPEILCQGEILNDVDQYIPYGNSGTWSQCSLSGDLGTPGVCCRNPEPVVSTSKPYVAANECGVRNYGLDLRIPVKLAKNEAQFGEFPWQAIIFFSNFTFKCGASLIEDRWLLTAAHCVHGYKYDDFRIRLGEWQVDKYDEPLKYVDVEIASITVHPDFKPGPVHNDIAVIELTAPVKFQYHINTLCLPSYGFIPSAGTRCFATGWGKDAFDGNYQTILKKVDVPVVEHSTCQNLLRKTRLGKYFILDKSFMCAGGEENIDACEGDGGGPLVCEDPESNTYYLAGITAWGIDCGKQDVPGVYVDVQGFSNWVEGIISPTVVQTEQQVSQPVVQTEQQVSQSVVQTEQQVSQVSGYGRK